LKAALPNCRIEWDGGVIEPKASPDTNRRVAEWVLSLKGPRYLNFLEPQTGTLNAVNELPNVPLKCFGVINISDDLVDDKVVENLRGVTDTLRLYLNSATLTDAGVDRLIDIAASWKSLGLLELSSTKLTDAGLANIPRLRQVEDLNISANISDAGLRHLEKMSLRGISLHSTSITDEGMKLLARHKLRRLELIWCNKISDMGFANLTELNDLEQLSLISLFGDGALKHLEALKKLKYLKVGSPNVTDTGLQQLSVLTTLTDLNVKGTKATADGVKKLATALPKCKIEWDGGVVEPKK
jgi:hypothetical protein